MYRTIAKKPRVSCRSNLRRVLDHEMKKINANQSIQTYEIESRVAVQYLNLLFDSDKTNYTSIEQRISWSITECGLYRDHLQKLNMRILVSKHKFLKIPSEPASMRFACQNCRSDVLVSQLAAGYSANSFIHESKTGGSLTTPLIAAMAFPIVVRHLRRIRADDYSEVLVGGERLDRAGESVATRTRVKLARPALAQSWHLGDALRSVVDGGHAREHRGLHEARMGGAAMQPRSFLIVVATAALTLLVDSTHETVGRSLTTCFERGCSIDVVLLGSSFFRLLRAGVHETRSSVW